VPTPEHRFGVPIAPVARAVADAVVGYGTLDDARALVALAVQRGSTAIDDLAAELAAGPHRGSAHLRLALDEIRDGARSAPEARAATALRRGGITGFEQNVEVYAHGRRFVADFLWRALRAILEVDGRDYHFDAREWMATNRRDAQLESAGYSVIHVTPSDLKDEADFVGRVRLWLAGRARRTVLPS
jgi:very-short-patch-repair endonuclease